MTLRMLLVALGIAAAVTATMAQRDGTHRVVFEVTTDDAAQWESILNNVENLRRALGEQATTVEVVSHAKGLGLLLKSNTQLQPRLQQLASTGVVFAACENTMRRMKVTRADLLPLATTVDSGVAEVVRKQESGWSYIKGGS